MNSPTVDLVIRLWVMIIMLL